jgi:hypothetical protein
MVALVLGLLGTGRGTAAEPPSAAPRDAVTLDIRYASEKAGEAKPWLVVLLFDTSGSMANGFLKPVGDTSRPLRWEKAYEFARANLASLQRDLKIFHLTVHQFATDAANGRNPVYSGLVDQNEDINLLAGRIERKLRSPDGATNLWSSLSNILEDAMRKRVGEEFAGMAVICLSDGEDALVTDSPGRSEGRRQAFLQTVRNAAPQFPVSFQFVKFAPLQDDFLKELREVGTVSEPTEPAPLPLVENLEIQPVRTVLPELPNSGSACEIGLSFPASMGAEQRKAASFRIDPPSPSFELSHTAGASSLVIRRKGGTVEGGSVRVVCQLPRQDTRAGNEPLTAVAILDIPASRLLPPVDDWGLPELCQGRRVLLLEQGTPLELPSLVPTSAKIMWSVDGQPRSSESTLRIAALEPGKHTVRLDADMRGDKKSAEVSVFVIDPELRIVSDPPRIEAGTSVRFSASTANALPSELTLSPTEWRGPSLELVKGTAFTDTFRHSGRVEISVRQEATLCGQSVVLKGRLGFQVERGASVDLLPATITRGRPSVVSAAVDMPERVAAVVFKVTDPGTGAIVATETAPVGRDPRMQGSGSTEARINYSGRSDSLTVTAMPLLKDDSGKALDASDPSCMNRTVAVQYPVVNPEVRLTHEPADSREFAFGEQFEIRVIPEGIDAAAIERVELGIRSAGGGVETKTLTAQSRWAHSVRSEARMGSFLSIEAKPLDANGAPVALTTPFKPFTIRLVPAVPELVVLSSDGKSGTIDWTGQGVGPPLLTAEIRIRGSGTPYPLSEQGLQVAWSGSPTVEADRARGDESSATFRIARRGAGWIEAQVGNQQLRAPFTAAPVDVRPAPVLTETQFAADSPARFDHSATTGAWTACLIRARVAGSEWTTLPSDGVLAPHPTSDATVEYQVWYQPWGVADSSEPWVSGSGWVGSELLGANLLKPRVIWIVALVALAGLALTVIGFWLVSDHPHRWVRIAWYRSQYCERGERVPGYYGETPSFRRAKYQFLRRTVRIQLPRIKNVREFEWTMLVQDAFIDWHNDGRHFIVDGHREDASLMDGRRVGINADDAGNFQLRVGYPACLHNQSQSDWAPLYLKILPIESSTTKAFGQHWIPLIIALLAIWGGFAFLIHVRII